MRFDAEVLVVGAGPAGSALAALLAERGHDVLLVDRHRFPRRKACGECLNPGGIAVLERLGLRRAVEATGPVPLIGWSIGTPLGRTGWAGFPEPLVGWGIDRATFDLALLNEARRRRARVMEGVRVESVDPGGGDRPARAMGDGIEIRSAVIVGADGLRSVVAREIGAVHRGARSRRLRKTSLTWRVRGTGPDRSYGRLLLGGEITVGLAPAPASGERDAWNATLVVGSARFGRGLRLAGWPLLESGLRTVASDWSAGPQPAGDPVASGPFDCPTRRVQAGRALLVGDSAGYYDPLTGQGIFRALRGAELAADAIHAGALHRYPGRLAREFRSGTAIQHLIEAVVARPVLRETAISLVAKSSAAGRALACIVGDTGTVGGMHAHHR